MASVADTGDQAPPSPPGEEVVIVRSRQNIFVRIARWLVILLGVLVLAAAGFLIWLNSEGGRRFIVEQINNLEFASGLDIDVDQIEGSIWGDFTLRGVTLADSKGVFFAAPRVQVDYAPLSYLQRSHVELNELIIPEARLARLPELKSTDPTAPLIPDIQLDIGQLRVGRLVVEPPVTGQRHILSIAGEVHLNNSTAKSDLRVQALEGPGVAGGDQLALSIDAAPEQNRLQMALKLQAPDNGFVTNLLGLDRPLQVELAGRGTWADWRGRLQAAVGGEALANLEIQAEDGTFSFNGPTNPGLFLTGPAQRLTAPFTLVNLVTTWENRRAELELRANSRALAVIAEGAIDFKENQFEDLSVAARLLQPGAIAPNLSGQDVRVALVLNGDISAPRVAYDLKAASLGISDRIFENFKATGSARLDGERIVVPVSASASRIRGLPDALGGLLTNVRFDGDILIEGSNILSDNLRVRSDRVDAVLALAFDVAKGTYNVGIQGKVNNYLVQSVGIFDITSDFDVVSQGAGFGLEGRVALRSREIFNQSAVNLLGGNATATATVALGDGGAVRIGDVRLTAPKLRITEGGGVYYPDGRLALQLRGTSTDYGPVSVSIGGTIQQPRVNLDVSRYDVAGLGLSGINAQINATQGGYAITATGNSNYGRFEADVLLSTAGGRTRVDINRLLIAGLTFAGEIAQTASGPFAGALSVSGEGINGDIRLAAAGPRQVVDIEAVARNAVIPSSIAGQAAIAIDRAIIDISATLPTAGDDFPVFAAEGDVQVAGLRSGDLTITQARTRFDYANGQGNAQFVATGSRGVPFDIAGNAQLNPNLILATLRGTVNQIPFRFAEPARIVRVGRDSDVPVEIASQQRGATDWLLRPVTILFQEGQGSLRLAGRLGEGVIIQSRLDSFDMSIANTLRPGLGLGGKATGSLDFYLPPGGAFPRAEARLNIVNATRTGIAMRSEPVNIALSGNLRPEGGSLSAVVREDGAVVGRMEARLQPLPAGSGSWTQRLLAAPLSGGIRYNGPAGVLTSLAGLTAHQISGQIGIGADFTGRVNNPQFTGVIRANNLAYLNEQYGTRITNIGLTGRFDGNQLQIVEMTGRAGEGTVRAQGTIGLAAANDYPIRIDARLDNARLARSDDLSATATGDIQIRNLPNERAVIRGELQLGEIRYQIVRQGAAQVSQLSGVRRKGQPLPEPGRREAETRSVPSAWNLDLDLVADNRVFVSGMGLESEWAARLNVDGTTAAPVLSGNINLVRGTLSLAGRRFILDDQSNITFPRGGDGRINPQLEIIAASEIDDVEVLILIEGSASNPRISFASTPNLPQDEIVSRILFGSSVTEISALQAIQLAASLNSLRGGSGGLDPLGTLRSATGIDRLRILGEDDTTGRGMALAAGFYLSDDIYLEIITDARGFTATQIEIALSRSLSLLSQFGTTTGTNANLRYSRDY